MASVFKIHSAYQPAGDQVKAIQNIADSFQKGEKKVTLVGVTGSGKTFTMAQVIQNLGLPTLVLSHNKTLAAQLFESLRSFFPKMQWNILFPIMIIINRRLMFLLRILLSRRTVLSTKRSINLD